MDRLAGRPHWRRFYWLILLALALIGWHVTASPALAQETGDHSAADMMTHIVSSAGIFFGPLLLLVSIGLVTLIVLLTLDLRLGAAVPPTLVETFAEAVGKGQFQKAYELCRLDHSFLARVLTAGMGRLQYGIEDARQAASNTLDSVRAGKEQLINYLGTIGTLGPMIGLVGTVFGMIQSFMELSKGGTPKSEELAKGISHALVVTLLGVALSVPAIFCYTLFRNRLVRITMDVGNLADDLLTQMFHLARSQNSDADGQRVAEPETLSPTIKPAA